MWTKVEDEKPQYGLELLGFNESWIDEDYNADGICVCFLQGAYPDYWVISKWCGYHDEWHTRHSVEAEASLGKASETQPYIDAPTHWMLKPNKPIY